MNKSSIEHIFKGVRTSVSKHSPEILIGLGITGMISTTVLAVRATPKAIKLIKEDSEKNHDGDPYAYTKVEAVKSSWKCYIPAAVTCVFSVSCLIGANSVNARRNAALATAYKISETALTEYKGKITEKLGVEKAEEIKSDIHKDRIEKNQVSKSEVILTEKGNTLCYDCISGRYFKSDVDKIKRAENELNKRMFNDMYISLNEFYDELDLDHIAMGYELGWNIEDGLIDVSFSTQIADDECTPCIVIDYEVAPKYGYNKIAR